MRRRRWRRPPAAPAQALTVDQALPIDPAVRTGQLANGLRYYIRRNGRPANRVSLRLAVNVGSVFEDDDQRGLAHFLEHMAFNGTENFKPGELISFLETIGARFGPHVNAYTSFDETVYMLDVPTDKPGYVDRGLLALHDFAAGMSLQAGRDRQGARRRHRGVARPTRRRLAARPTSSCRCCSPSRATPSGCRSARPRFSSRSRASDWSTSIASGIARIRWP